MIPVNQPLLGGNEKKYLGECIDSGWISSDGPFVKRFERELSGRIGRQYGIAVCNGSAALDIAVAALGIGPGDEVILPTFTIISCAAAIVRAGAKPVVVDADPLTWNMQVRGIERFITARTKAIMAVHIYGLPTEIGPLCDLAKRRGLRLIEDAAEAIGQTYNGRPCGSFGDVSTFSFYANKHVTTGEGGMVLTDDEVLAGRCRGLRNLCFGELDRFRHVELGWNYRMTNLQAAVGVAQLERLDETLKKKRQIGGWYDELLAHMPLDRAPSSMPYADNIWWVYGAVLPDSVSYDRDEVTDYLYGHGIETRPFFWPMHEQPVLRGMGIFNVVYRPVAERIARRGFYLPSGVALTFEQAQKVVAALRTVLC